MEVKIVTSLYPLKLQVILSGGADGGLMRVNSTLPPTAPFRGPFSSNSFWHEQNPKGTGKSQIEFLIVATNTTEHHILTTGFQHFSVLQPNPLTKSRQCLQHRWKHN